MLINKVTKEKVVLSWGRGDEEMGVSWRGCEGARKQEKRKKEKGENTQLTCPEIG